MNADGGRRADGVFGRAARSRTPVARRAHALEMIWTMDFFNGDLVGAAQPRKMASACLR